MMEQDAKSDAQADVQKEQSLKIICATMAACGVSMLVVAGMFLEGIYFEQDTMIGAGIGFVAFTELVMAWLFFNRTIKLH